MASAYPSLYAALIPDTVNGRRGFTVQCTASLRSLGFIWWENPSGTIVTWHWRTGASFGERTTERNAVQALRDVSNAASARALPIGPVDAAPTAHRQTPPASVAPSPAQSRQGVVWSTTGADLTVAVAAALTHHLKGTS